MRRPTTLLALAALGTAFENNGFPFTVTNCGVRRDQTARLEDQPLN